MSAARITVEVPFSASVTPVGGSTVDVTLTAHTANGRPVYAVTGEINYVITYLWSSWHSSATEVLTALRSANAAE
jgi:hypothetical protein